MEVRHLLEIGLEIIVFHYGKDLDYNLSISRDLGEVSNDWCWAGLHRLRKPIA
jgi:hypothetical protein